MSRTMIAIVAFVVVAGGVTAWAVWPGGPKSAPDPTTMETDEVARYVASKDFGKLPVDQRMAFMEQAREATEAEGGSPMRRFFSGMESLSEEQQQRARENMRDVGRAYMDKRLREYSEASPEEKTRMLDEMIDRMQERMDRRRDRPEGERRAQRPADNDGERRQRDGDGDGRRRGFTPERLKRHIEGSDPEIRAMRMQFMEDLRDRMKERGIDAPWGRGRRG